MDDLRFYFNTGWEHIISWDAVDHLLFLTVLAASYLVKDWRSLVVAITLFSIGHTLALVLGVLGIMTLNAHWIEFLVALTIIATGATNLLVTRKRTRESKWNYISAGVFGILHGLAFSSVLKFMLAKHQGPALPIASFTLGIEAGQLAFVTIILLVSFMLVNKSGLSQIIWLRILSLTGIIAGLYMAVTRFPS